ncbi:MAG: GlcG/HbpS family heme-binding protein [Actinophytocola sp.]|uniref:GlcG/HbpS family heme-binding protein n=1 Tax=Actinophytocola sp. TaxID=1872138 RepID=UPI003D6BFB8A
MNAVVTKPSISQDAAASMMLAAVAKARELSIAQAVAVLDDSGVLKAFVRMDGAALVAVDVAQRKAFTALYGLPSHALFDAIKGDPALLTSMPLVPRFTMIGGGFPITVDDVIVGAIGVSGGTVDQDIECARAALHALDAAAS